MEYIASQGGAPYVLPLVATYGDDQAVYVILPFCPNGDLFGVVERHGALQEATAATYMGQLVRGLEGLHAMGLMHHDISLENTMVDAESRAIIIDFGMAVKAIPTATDFFDGRHARGRSEVLLRSACMPSSLQGSFLTCQVGRTGPAAHN